MDLTTGYSISLPVFHAEAHPDERYLISGEVRGTAFGLGGDFLLTAAHVMEGIPTEGNNVAVVGISHPEFGIKAALIQEFEQFSCDIALCRVVYTVPGLDTCYNRFRWSPNSLNPYDPVRAIGYAYGIHRVDDRQMCVVRGFQGYIVSGLNEFKPVGMQGEPFRVYEISFAAPRGLSGSPLLNASGSVIIHGVVIGNSDAKMLVFSSEEKSVDGDSTSVVEQYESLTLGIAVTAEEVMGLHSDILGATIGEHLEQSGLLAR